MYSQWEYERLLEIEQLNQQYAMAVYQEYALQAQQQAGPGSGPGLSNSGGHTADIPLWGTVPIVNRVQLGSGGRPLPPPNSEDNDRDASGPSSEEKGLGASLSGKSQKKEKSPGLPLAAGWTRDCAGLPRPPGWVNPLAMREEEKEGEKKEVKKEEGQNGEGVGLGGLGSRGMGGGPGSLGGGGLGRGLGGGSLGAGLGFCRPN